MTRISDILKQTLSRRFSRRMTALFLLALPVLAVLSYFFILPDSQISPQTPGGLYLEAAFWTAALGSSFLSFVIMEVLFRSRETRILAPLPVQERDLFSFQMKRIFTGIAISSLPAAAVWMPHLSHDSALRIIACFAVWPVSLCICTAVSAAIVLYAGNSAAQSKSEHAAKNAMVFSTSPAIALGISLILTLLIKLLAEALLKTGFANAAASAAALIFAAFIIAMLSANILFRRRYYAILAYFIDTDLIVLDANCEFVDDAETKKICAAKSRRRAITLAMTLQYRRRFAASSLLIITFAVLLAILAWAMPEYLSSIYLPLLAPIPLILLSKPWLALHQPEFDSGFFDAMPIGCNDLRAARRTAAFHVFMPQAAAMAAAVFLPMAAARSLTEAAVGACIVLLISSAVCAAGCFIAEIWPRLAPAVTYALTPVFVFSAILLA